MPQSCSVVKLSTRRLHCKTKYAKASLVSVGFIGVCQQFSCTLQHVREIMKMKKDCKIKENTNVYK